jgi:ABC-2 type transport system permease protein
MRGILLLTQAEVNRLRRNRRYLIFTIALPVILYLIIGKQGSKAYGVDFAAYYMIAMATFGAFAGALNGNAIRISEERKVGWIRQLRLTPLPANAYVIAKILTSMVISVPTIVIVLLLGRFYGGVHLDALWQWFVIAVIVWLGSTIFAALAVAIGYRFPPDQVQPITFVVYFTFTILGGIWFPLSGALQDVGKATPTYEAVKISTDVIANVSVPYGLVLGLVVWLLIFAGLATLSVRSMAESV